MLVPMRLAPGIADGSVTVLLRRWKRTAGDRRPPLPDDRRASSRSTRCSSSTPPTITEADARAAGAPDVATAIGELRGTRRPPVTRVRFHVVHDPDPRDVLAAADVLTDDDVADIGRRLERMDRAAAHGPWTLAALQAIAARPEVRAGDLAEAAGRERLEFKRDIRKLKALGLTLSFPIGYRLSARGQAYLARRG